MLDRLLGQRSFEESIAVLCCILATVFVAPFILLRAWAGEWLHAAVDAAATLAIVASGWYVWSTGRTEIARPLVAVIFLVTLVTIVYLFDHATLLWAYPATAASFFVLRPTRAAILNLLAIAALLPRLLTLEPATLATSFLITLLASNVLALAYTASMARSRSRFRLLAERDALTGAGNRRALNPALSDALAKRNDFGTPSSLIAFDIDHFKDVNDQYGHEAGDRVLVGLTKLIHDNVRAGDDVFRYGGEELIVLAHGARAEPAGGLANSLRTRIERTPLHDGGPITISAGVAEALPGDTPDTWFRRADEMLYAAKNAGRNRVRIDTEREPDPQQPHRH